MHLNLKNLSLIFFFIALLSACKKDERTVSEWEQLAETKLREIEMLSENLPCEQQKNISIQEFSNGCSSKYYAILNSDLNIYNKKKQEYFDLLGKQTDAMIAEGYIIEPCWDQFWSGEQPIRLECVSGKVQLITSQNLSIEEAKPLAEETYKKIMDHVSAQNCTDASYWDYTALVKDKDKAINLEYIPFSRKDDIKEFRKMASLYNSLQLSMLNREGQVSYNPNIKRVKSIECVNGRPAIVLTD